MTNLSHVGDTPPGGKAAKSPVTAIATITAVVLALLYLVVVGLLLFRFGLEKDPVGNWEHALTIFNAISTVGFAAVGVLLGTTVQQTNVVSARKEAADAKVSENQMSDAANKLAVAAQAKLATVGSQLEALDITPDPGHMRIDDRLAEAIRNVDELLRARSLRR